MTGSSLNLSGLASGVDTNSIVDQLMAIERRPSTRIKGQQREAQARQDALRDVRTRLANLKAAGDDLRSAGAWSDVQSLDVGDPSRIAATRVGATGPGGYAIDVTKLARAEQRTFAYTPQSGDTTIAFGGVTIDVPAGATLDQVVSSVNSASRAPAYAVAVNGSLLLSSRQTGAANGFAAAGPAIAEDLSKYGAGTDAQLTVDGVPVSSPSNVTTSAVPGLQLTLKGVGQTSVIVGAPGADIAGIQSKVKAFVEQYNSTVSFIRGKLTETRERGADGELTKGLLAGDSMLQSTISTLRNSVSAGYQGVLGKLSAIGISGVAAVGSGSLDQTAIQGKLVLDDKVLASVLTGDRQDVRELLGATPGGSGFLQALSAIVDPAAQSGGALDGRISSEDANKRALTDQLGRLDKRLEQKQTLLKRQFSGMELALQKSQAQGQWLAGQLAQIQKR